MYIKSLTLNNFRNYENEKITFSSGINMLVGNNAQGKTNCAEAIFYLCTGYSPRAGRDKQVIKNGCEKAEIVGVAESLYGEVEVKIIFTSKKKEVFLNGVPLDKIGELMGNINSVFFNPQDLKLIQQSPEDRRRFLDLAISQMDKSYFYALQRYRRILEQRNALLKHPDREVIFETLSLWDKELATVALKIINKRQEFMQKLAPHAIDAHAFISGGEKLELSLETPYYLGGGVEELIASYAEKTEKDLVLGYTTVGPHRDDIKIKVNGEDVRVYGSQGQQRTCALSLKLGELETFKNAFNEYPVLILDDALSELDKNRRNRLIDRLSGIQTIITTTEFISEFTPSNNLKILTVNSGKIE
ncbi:MAG: DNA replication/repair protein RecF [Clostridia bacterium]|nr:DNA replication/repair protein RecF [Clostridia bacterium]